ncbi:MAG: alpha/beta hydrolase [Cyanobacteria bacterium P01_A01_bin.17]
MFPSFLPAETAQLTEATSINTAQMIQQHPIQTCFSPNPILTTYLQQEVDGVPLLLLHGFDSSLLEFRRLFPLLTEQRSTWAVDLLGFGFTDRPLDITFSPAELKLHLYHFWKTLIDQPVILVGASMGGALALDFCLTYPDCVDRLVLLDSAGFATSAVPTRLMRPPIDGWATAFLRNPGVRRRISIQAYCDRNYVTPDAEICASLHLQHPRWQEALIAFAKSGGYNFLADKIDQISQPTLILWGEQDRIMNRKDAPKFERAIADSQLIWVPNCGHVPHLEQPQLTAEHILEFMS